MFEQAISAMASVVVDPYLLGLIFATTILGVIIGVLPGLGATTGAALLLPSVIFFILQSINIAIKVNNSNTILFFLNLYDKPR